MKRVKERTERAEGGGCLAQSHRQRLPQDLLPVEQHFALVSEMSEVGSLGDAGALRDLGRRRPFKAVLAKKLESLSLQPRPDVLAVNRHKSFSSLVSD